MEEDNVARTPFTYFSIFAGIAGLDLGFCEGARRVGLEPRCVGMVEIEAYAAAVLVSAMEEGRLAPVPIWCGDVAKCVPPKADVLIGGFPCPPVSVAGKRKGIDDPRWLFPQVLRVIDDTGCRLVFLENVEGLSRDPEAFGAVTGGLSDRGFDAAWLHLEAAQVGAPHERNRIFILAWKGAGVDLVDASSVRLDVGRRGAERLPEPGPPDAQVAHPSGLRRGQPRADAGSPGTGQTEGRVQQPARGGGEVADAQQGRWGRRTPSTVGQEGHGPSPRPGTAAGEEVGVTQGKRHDGGGGSRRGESGLEDASRPFRWPPLPGDAEGWREVLDFDRALAPALPTVRRVGHGPARLLDLAVRYRANRVRAIGNSVVPAQAAEAFTELWRRMREVTNGR